jgi:hypothetical protein
MFGGNLSAAQSFRTRSPIDGRPTASRGTWAKRFSTTPTRTALRHYVGPGEMASVRLPALLSCVPSLREPYSLLRYYGRSDPDRPLRHRLRWFPDSRHQNFPPFCLQPSTVLGQTRSTPSTLAALFCSGFAVRSQARQNRRPNRVHFVRQLRRTTLRTGGSLPVALHPGYGPDAVTFSYWPYRVGQVRDFHPAVAVRSQAHGPRSLPARALRIDSPLSSIR